MFLRVDTEVLKVQDCSGLWSYSIAWALLWHFTSWSPCNERLSATCYHCDTTVLPRLAHLNGMKPQKLWAQINLPLLPYFREVLENRSTSIDHWHWEGWCHIDIVTSPWQNWSRGSQIAEMSLDVFLEKPARQSLECYKESFLEQSSGSLEDLTPIDLWTVKTECVKYRGGGEDFFFRNCAGS